MLNEFRTLLGRNSDALARDAFGLAGLLVAILAGLFLPALA